MGKGIYKVDKEGEGEYEFWNDWDWDGFLRFAYGLQPTAGYGDVNADLIQSSAARDAGSELSSEVEPPTLRVYAGIGTGW